MHGLRFAQQNKIKVLMQIVLLMWAFLIFILIYYSTQMDGSYSKEINVIIMYPKEHSPQRLFYVSAHEIGHYIYFKKMTTDERNTYEKIYKDSNIFISNYSKTNVAENFAEEFSARVQVTINHDMGSDDRNSFFIETVNKYLFKGDDVNDSNE